VQRAGVENKLIHCGGSLDWTEEHSSVSGKESSGSEIRIAGDGVYLYLYLEGENLECGVSGTGTEVEGKG
jgi:hypothetical protein